MVCHHSRLCNDAGQVDHTRASVTKADDADQSESSDGLLS